MPTTTTFTADDLRRATARPAGHILEEPRCHLLFWELDRGARPDSHGRTPHAKLTINYVTGHGYVAGLTEVAAAFRGNSYIETPVGHGSILVLQHPAARFAAPRFAKFATTAREAVRAEVTL